MTDENSSNSREMTPKQVLFLSSGRFRMMQKTEERRKEREREKEKTT